MKPDPSRLKRETYPVVTAVPTRFDDLDPLGHVNNVAVASVYQEGRVALHHRLFPREMRERLGMRFMIADLHIAYLGEAHHPGGLEVGAGIERIGTSSYTIALALFQDGACVGTCESVIVNTRDDRPAPLPEEARALLEDHRLKTA